MKQKQSKRRWLLATLVFVVVLLCALTVTAVASARTNEIARVNLVLNNNVDIAFWADISESTAKDGGTYMTFNDGAPVSYSGMKTSTDGGTYAVYRYTGVLPQNLGDSVTAKLYVGGALTSTKTYSVKDYCQYTLTSNASSDYLKTLVSDLLVYGAAAQAYVGDNADTYVTNGITGLVASATPTDFTVLYGAEKQENLARAEQAMIDQAGLRLTNSIELYFDITLTDPNALASYTARMTINGRVQEVPVTLEGGTYRATFDGICASEFFDSVKVGIYKDGSRVSKSVTFSLAAYIDAQNSVAELTNITNAIYNYGVSAHAYAGKHIVKMPGDFIKDGGGGLKYDLYGTVTYYCALCHAAVDTIQVTNMRTFDVSHILATAAENKGDNDSSTTKFTISKVKESNGNYYYSFVRDSATNTGTGTLGYFFDLTQSTHPDTAFYLDNQNQFNGSKFTFSFDVKAPEAGIAPASVDLYHASGSSADGNRFGTMIHVNADGSLTLNGTTIAPIGTVSPSTWTQVTIMFEFCQINGEDVIYLEYYVNGSFSTALTISNTMLNNTFTRIRIGMSSSNLMDGQGLFYDNLFFAQGCVHSFTGSVEEHLANQDEEQLSEIIDLIEAGFDISDFSTVVRYNKSTSKTYTEEQAFRSLDTNTYVDPLSLPQSGQHPRLLFNSSDIPAILANMERPESAVAVKEFLNKVNTVTDGKLTPTKDITPQAFEHTNYDAKLLGAIEAKALYYALYKDASDGEHDDALMRGYQAIYAMKNYLLTFDVQWKASDQCRYYGHVMYVAALVYDWCYDLLSDADKLQLMTGVQNLCCDGTNNDPGNAGGNTHDARKMEGGFPPMAIEFQHAITGHGAEFQYIRDYFSFAIAIFDEDPTWYDYVGGLIYQEYVDVRNYFYAGSFYPDGSANYNYYRYICDVWNAWLFKGMGVDIPYNSADMATVIHGMIAMEAYDGYQFVTGDGTGTVSLNGKVVSSRIPSVAADCALISSFLFNDDVALAIAMEFHNRYSSFSYSQGGISAADYLILTANGLTPTEDYKAYVDNVEYHGGFQQQIISRSGKDEDSVAVLMQGAQHLPGGHTHQNAGNFQIYYKGMLTRDDGLYDGYGTDHHFYYHMSTTAHNGLLIYNPSLSSTMKGYYNGSQKFDISFPNRPGAYEAWINDDRYSFGELIGMQYDSEDNPTYVYFANDITKAYDTTTVDYVERSFMTLYTGDKETPMVMFIFDTITSDSASFQKTFLLQCAEEPQISGNTVTVDNGEGKMVLTSLKGADTIKAYGRTSKNGVVGGGNGSERFYLSGAGKNLAPGGAGSIGDSNTDLSVVWGHVEVQPNTGNKTNHLMNVIYVSDSGQTVSATPTLVESAHLTGATFKSFTSMFVNDTAYSASEHTFTTSGSGTMTYYVGGLNEGTWNVSINGTSIGEFEATNEGRMITFQGAVGTVTLTPGDDIRPANSGIICYNLDGGQLPSGAPTYYSKGEATALPSPTKSGAVFDGWFSDAALTKPINAIPADAGNTYTVYAKWTNAILDVDYTKGGTMQDYSYVTHQTNNGTTTTASYELITGNEKYLLWTSTGTNSQITKNGQFGAYASNSLAVSFELTIGRNGTDALAPLQIFARDTATSSSTLYMHFIYMDANGNVYFGSSASGTKFTQIADSGMTTIRFVIDFGSATIFAYDANGACLASDALADIGIALPDVYSSYADWFKNLNGANDSVINIKFCNTGAVRVGGFRILSGNVYAACRHYSTSSDAHTWDNGTVISAASTTNCTPGIRRYICTTCGAVKDTLIASTKQHTLTHSYEDGILTYSCTVCGTSWSPDTYYFLDGSSDTNMVGVDNAHYATTGASQPVINSNGEYELLNVTGSNGQGQLWIPSNSSQMEGFSSEQNAVGFLSFKMSTSMESGFAVKLVESTGRNGWGSEYAIQDDIFKVSVTSSGLFTKTYKTTITGWDGISLASSSSSSSSTWSGWIDVKIGIVLDPSIDQITCYYFINGEYKGSASRALTTYTNAIDSVYFSGKTTTVGTGLKLDDIGFGFSADGSELPINQ